MSKLYVNVGANEEGFIRRWFERQGEWGCYGCVCRWTGKVEMASMILSLAFERVAEWKEERRGFEVGKVRRSEIK